jgi:DNA-directed RNA polymerase II subunit RPB2
MAVRYLKALRRNALINIFTSISYDIKNKKINIYTDGGRVCRPLLIVKNNKINTDIIDPNMTNWYELAKGNTIDSKEYDIYNTVLHKKFNTLKTNDKELLIKTLEENSAPIEFIDVNETNHCLIAMFERDLNDGNKYTHCEIHPSTMFSVYTACIPLSNHNQAPRNVFSGAQGKQAIGIYATNFNNRIDTLGILMNYPEKPLVQTRYNSLLKINDLPNGNNLIVAISTYMGYNQEDSIIFNKNSIERGLFNITYMYSHISFESNENEEASIFANPVDLISRGEQVEVKKYANYEKIDSNGLPIINTYIEENDVIVGKCSIAKKKNDIDLFDEYENTQLYKSNPDIADKTMTGFVDKVFKYKNKDNQNAVKVNIRKFKVPELGDKLASRHGQKGVIGMILPQEDMPRTSDGIVPDIIMNPHAFPSRMTIGHLLECIVAKSCIINGQTADLTPFENHDYSKYYNNLDKAGYQYYGDEILYNGINGSQMNTQIFFGPTYYYRLKHMVSDKINYRSPGKVATVTRQPPQGRSNEGGLRIGEMETNCLLAYGISSFTKETFNERSDKYSYYIDNETGGIAGVNVKEHIYNGHTDITKVFTPYSYKLFTQELNTMAVHAKMLTKPDVYNHLSDEENYVISDTESEENENE